MLFMDTIVFCPALIFFFSTLFLIYKLNFKSKSSHPKPPSPPSVPIIGHLYLLKKPLHRSLSSLSRRYGPILSLRFGSRPVLIVSSLSLVEECFTRNDIVFANRPHLLAGKYIGFNYTTLGWSSYGPNWRNLRRIVVTEIFSSIRVNMFSSVRSDEIRILVKGLFRDSDLEEAVDLHRKFSELTLNMLMRMIAGKRYCGERVVDLEEATEFLEIVKESLAVSGASNLLDYLPVLRWIGFKGVEKRMLGLVKRRDVLLQGLIDEHRRKKKDNTFESGEEMKMKKMTLIDVLLSQQETEPEYCTDNMIKGIVMASMGAGAEALAATVEWAMSLLLNKPEVMKKVKAELDTVVGKDRFLDESDLDELPYLQSVINETLRLYPANPLSMPHESSEECLVGGFHVPRGTMLLANLWAIQRDPNLWEDPTSFMPERFEEYVKKGFKEGMNFKFLPFGYGRRSCPGMAMSIKVLGLALRTLIQCFEWRRVGQEKVDMMEGGGITMPKVRPLVALYRPYVDMVDLLSQL